MENKRIEFIKNAPEFEQAQYSLKEQIQELHFIANRLGLYDAADFIKDFR